MTVLDIIETALHTLDSIHVSGQEDMKKMLGVIEALTQVRDIAKHPPESDKPEEAGEADG